MDYFAGLIQFVVRCPRAKPAQLSAVAMGALDTKRTPAEISNRLAQLTDARQVENVRIFAAHALFRLGQMPQAAATGVASMLLSANPQARQVALLALSPFARRKKLAEFASHTQPTGQQRSAPA